MSKCYDNPEYDNTYSDIQNTWQTNKKMKQTAVEWLLENSHIISKNELNKRELIEQAKEMEKQQSRFTNSPIHDKEAIIQMMDELHPKEMIEVVEFINLKLVNNNG